jgi:hypothetical protein
MGSKLRQLRAKAGVTGYAHQKRQREAARRKERARLSFQDGNVIVGVNSPPAMLGAAMPSFTSDLVLQKSRLEQRRMEVAHILGSHDGAAELGDAIHAAALARAQTSVHPNHEVIDDVWEDALRQLRSGVSSGDLTVLNGPNGLDVHAKGSDLPSAAMALAAVGERLSGAPGLAPEPGMRAPHRRMAPMATLLALSMMAGLALPPKEDR